MGRHAEGWKLEWRRGIGYVRFTHAKAQHLISTGKRDAGAAREEAARLYARVVSGGTARPASTRALVLAPLPELLAAWLTSLQGTLDPETIKTYETTYVGRHWLAHFDSIEDMCSPAARERYRSARLGKALAKTVKKECWAQDKFLRWCKRVAKVLRDVPERLEWDKRTTGVRTGKQRAQPRELTREQVASVLAALPEWRETGRRAFKKKPFPVRDRFVFMYETSLRPATLSALVWDDWKGALLRIRPEVDKTRFGRDVPLSANAQAALERVRRGYAARDLEVGPATPIFGEHLYRKTLARAAKVAGLDGVAPYDLRHGRGTHLADDGASLTGIGYLLGHKQLTTTNRYLHGSVRAAEEALFKGSRAPSPESPPAEQGDRRGSNPRHLEPQSANDRPGAAKNTVDAACPPPSDTPQETAGNGSGLRILVPGPRKDSRPEATPPGPLFCAPWVESAARALLALPGLREARR